jgi:4-diphosphocytidyl-2-C-methyl-D-erythritol kinase
MSITVRSFAKINLGLKIGPARADGFHELRTIYQTLALHDRIQVEVQSGSGIEIRCNDPRVPLGESNTCYRVAERVLKTVRTQAKVVIDIDKRLPVQGGMGASSSNAAATMLGLERALGKAVSAEDKMRIAAEVGSDVPLFLIGGTVLGVGRGEEVYPLADLPSTHLVVVTPEIGVSTPRAFAQWDGLVAGETELTTAKAAGTINEFVQGLFARLSEGFFPQTESASGVPARGGDRAGTLLLDLVRAGIENDFERVVFPEYPELREVKSALERAGARYASLSGSGSTVYGLYGSSEDAQAAAARLGASGYAAVATTTLTRDEYWKQIAAGN